MFVTPRDARQAGLPILGPSRKTIAMADNNIIQASHRTQLPYDLPATAMDGDVVPGFGNSLVGVKPFADAGCITILHP